MPAASPAPPQTSLPDASSSLFGLLLEAELPEGEEARTGMQGAGDEDSKDNEPQVLPWWPGLTAVGAAQSIASAISRTAAATSDEAKLRPPSEKIHVDQTATVEPAKSSSALSERRAAELPRVDSSAEGAFLAPAEAAVPAAELGFSPGRPSSSDASPIRMADEAAEGKLKPGGPNFSDRRAAQAGEAPSRDAKPEPNSGLVGSQSQAREVESSDRSVSKFPVSAGDLAVGNKLGLPLPEARGREAEPPARNGRPHSLAPQKAAHAITLAPAVQMMQEDGLQTGTPAALLTEAAVENDPRNAGGWVRPDPTSSVLVRSPARDADTAAAGQTEERLTSSEGSEPTAPRAAGGAALPASQPSAPTAAGPQPTQAPVVSGPPQASLAMAAELGRQAMQEPQQPSVRPNQVPAETLGQATAVVPGVQTDPVSNGGRAQSGPVLPEIAPRPNPNPKGGGSSTLTAAKEWSGLPEGAAGAPLWGSEVAFTARLAEPAEAATWNPNARSLAMPGARRPIEAGAPGRAGELPDRLEMGAHKTGQDLGRAQAMELLGNDRRAQPPGETAVETRSGLAEEPAPAPRRPMVHAGAAVEFKPLEAVSRPVAEWSAANTAHRQDPAAETGQATGGTQAKSLREAVPPADPAEPLIQGQPASAVRELRVRVAEAGVEVRLRPAARELHVAVRTPQPDLREALRGGLDELASRLAERGLEAQIWRPGSSSGWGGAAERGWETLRAQLAEGGEPGAGRRGHPDQQPPGDQQRRQPDPRWGEAWSEREGEAAPPVWRLRR